MNLYISQKYSNHEQFCKDSFRWEVQFKKLSPENFHGGISLIDIGDIQIGKIQLNGILEQNGISPIGYRTFVIPVDKLQTFKYLNRTVSEKDLLLFSQQGVLDAVSYQNFHYYMISIKEELLSEITEKYELTNSNKILNSSENVFRLNATYFTHIQDYLNQIFHALKNNPRLINSVSFLYRIRYKFSYLILSFIDARKFSPVSIKNRKRDKAVKISIDFINRNLLKDISVLKLTEISGVSEKTLQLAFLEYFGVTPKEYYTNLKLNEVRTHFIKNINKNTLVSDIAQKVGFNHLGQFSASYKLLFNEYPKQTLKQNKLQLL